MVAHAIEVETGLKVYRYFCSLPTCLFSQFVIAADLASATKLAKARASSQKNGSKFGFIVAEPFCDCSYEAVKELGIVSLLTDEDKTILAEREANQLGSLLDQLHTAVRRETIAVHRSEFLKQLRAVRRFGRYEFN